MDIHTRLLAAIAAIPGNTSGEVAEWLYQHGHRGLQGSRYACPVACYLESATGLPIAVGDDATYVDSAGQMHVFELPAHVLHFVECFDSNKFPALKLLDR